MIDSESPDILNNNKWDDSLSEDIHPHHPYLFQTSPQLYQATPAGEQNGLSALVLREDGPWLPKFLALAQPQNT